MFLTKKRLVFFASKKGCLFQEPLFFSSACFKNRSSLLLLVSRTAQRNTNFLFICFNGSFLFWTEEHLFLNKKNHKRTTARFKNSKKGLFPKEVEEKHKLLFFCFNFVSEEPLKEGFVSKKEETENKFLFICFNGSFLNSRTASGSWNKQQRTIVFWTAEQLTTKHN